MAEIRPPFAILDQKRLTAYSSLEIIFFRRNLVTYLNRVTDFKVGCQELPRRSVPDQDIPILGDGSAKLVNAKFFYQAVFHHHFHHPCQSRQASPALGAPPWSEHIQTIDIGINITGR